jgi:hypothetical protein
VADCKPTAFPCLRCGLGWTGCPSRGPLPSKPEARARGIRVPFPSRQPAFPCLRCGLGWREVSTRAGRSHPSPKREREESASHSHHANPHSLACAAGLDGGRETRAGRSHPSPKREREESASHSHHANRIPLLALRAWMEGVRLARATPIQARSASERNPRPIPITPTRIPLLALRAWMREGDSRGPLPSKPEARARGIRVPFPSRQPAFPCLRCGLG